MGRTDFADYAGRFRRTEHYFGDGFRRDPQLIQLAPDPSAPQAPLAALQLDVARIYQPGQRYVERWNHAPYGPSSKAIRSSRRSFTPTGSRSSCPR